MCLRVTTLFHISRLTFCSFFSCLRAPWQCVPDVGRGSQIVCWRRWASVSMPTVSAAAPAPAYLRGRPSSPMTTTTLTVSRITTGGYWLLMPQLNITLIIISQERWLVCWTVILQIFIEIISQHDEALAGQACLDLSSYMVLFQFCTNWNLFLLFLVIKNLHSLLNFGWNNWVWQSWLILISSWPNSKKVDLVSLKLP